MNYDTIVVLDFDGTGAQTTDKLKLVRSFGVFSEIMHYGEPLDKIRAKNAKGFIMAGNPEIDAKFANNLNAPVLDAREVKNETVKAAVEDFIFNKCGCAANWEIDDFINDIDEHIKTVIGGRKAVCALSGGVDSSVSAVIVNKAIGRNLSCIFVDTGLMRLNEGDEVMAAYRDLLGMNVIRVNAEERFLSKLKGVTDPETKRKIIGEEFIRVFEEEARKLGDIDFLVQGTIYPDIIESGTKNKALVKSHHNVGGLPEKMDFKGIIEPVQELFKDEVRMVGIRLGIPERLINRQPFPGPGLAVRVIGEVTKEKLDILRRADFIVRDEIQKSGLGNSIWQYFAILTGVESVGVKNDSRTYGHVAAVRAIHSSDAMLAEWARLPYDTLVTISTRITSDVPEISRVVYDITSKPPATIEWE